MIFGVELQEIINAVIQISAAVAGSAAFFGIYFFRKARKDKGRKSGNLKIARDLLKLLVMALFIFFIFWGWNFFKELTFITPNAFAHEGIAAEKTAGTLALGRMFAAPAIIILLLGNLLALVFGFWLKKGENLKWLYWFNLILLAFVMFFKEYTGDLTLKQVFVGFHGVHSIWTLGAATLVDYLYVKSIKASNERQAATYLAFPVITKFIWAGLALDAISALGVFDGHLEATTKFLFLQTVLAILVINAVFLTRKIGSNLTRQAQTKGKVEINPRLSFGAIIFGSISIVSWYTLTITDFFENLTAAYWQLFLIYAALIAVGILVGYFFENKTETP